MWKFLRVKFVNHYLPRWIVMIIDNAIIGLSLCFTLIIFNLNGHLDLTLEQILLKSLVVLPWFFIGWIIFKPHNGIIRYFSMHDIIRFIYAHLIGTAGVSITTFLASNFITQKVLTPNVALAGTEMKPVGQTFAEFVSV